MLLARVQGAIVATKKDPAMGGRKLLVVTPEFVDPEAPTRFRSGQNSIVAVDSVGAGNGELVLVCQGSSARLAPGFEQSPVDAVIVGIVDRVDVLGEKLYSAAD
jgi:ethanolamine utilization protein EutN